MLSRTSLFFKKLYFHRTNFNLICSCDKYYKQQNDRSNAKRNEFQKLVFTSVITMSLGYYIIRKQKNYCSEIGIKPPSEISPGKYRNDLPLYSIEEVGKHTNMDNRIWVTYKEGVYDITEFIVGHPGGDQILMAAGNSVEPFWLLYSIHENPHVYEILEAYRIGNLKVDENDKLTKDLTDPYRHDPRRHPVLKTASKKPFNAETPPSLLIENFYTPNDFFYVRNHLPVPEIDPQTYQLDIEIEQKTISFSLDELKRMPKTTITATVMCAGNRRSEMTTIKPVKGLNWGIAAIGNATWTGVLLRDVLKKIGVEDNIETEYNHIQFEGMDFDATGKTYGASIPIWKGLDKRGDVLLAYEMNGVPIPQDHGFPIRVIVPGVVGARNVKWLAKIIISKEESDCHWQQNDYKGFSPSVDWDTVDFSKSPAIQELPVISAICKPQDGESVEVADGKITVKGYAWSGGGQKIVRVDVTADAGKTWHVAEFDHQDSALPPKHWAWTLWSVEIPINKSQKTVEVWAKAVDSSYNTQPENFENIWNLRGVLSNAYHRVKLKVIH